MQRVTITLPEEDAKALRDIADQDGKRGMGSVVRAALTEYLPTVRITPAKQTGRKSKKGGRRSA